jgi:histone H3/H4
VFIREREVNINVRGIILPPDETKQKSNPEVTKALPNIPFSRATLKKFFVRHIVRKPPIVKKPTRVSRDALDLMNRVLDDIGGWVIRESERMAANEGKSTIQAKHIRAAVKQYLGGEEVNVEK